MTQNCWVQTAKIYQKCRKYFDKREIGDACLVNLVRHIPNESSRLDSKSKWQNLRKIRMILQIFANIMRWSSPRYRCPSPTSYPSPTRRDRDRDGYGFGVTRNMSIDILETLHKVVVNTDKSWWLAKVFKTRPYWVWIPFVNLGLTGTGPDFTSGHGTGRTRVKILSIRSGAGWRNKYPWRALLGG